MAELEDLVVSGEEMDKKLVAEILSPFVRLDKDKNTVRPIEGWDKLDEEEKILVYLLSKKAMVALQFGLPAESAGASEVIQNTGVKKGTTHPALRKLLGERLLEQTSDRKYFVPNYAITRIKSMLGHAKNKGGQK